MNIQIAENVVMSGMADVFVRNDPLNANVQWHEFKRYGAEATAAQVTVDVFPNFAHQTLPPDIIKVQLIRTKNWEQKQAQGVTTSADMWELKIVVLVSVYAWDGLTAHMITHGPNVLKFLYKMMETISHLREGELPGADVPEQGASEAGKKENWKDKIRRQANLMWEKIGGSMQDIPSLFQEQVKGMRPKTYNIWAQEIMSLVVAGSLGGYVPGLTPSADQVHAFIGPGLKSKAKLLMHFQWPTDKAKPAKFKAQLKLSNKLDMHFGLGSPDAAFAHPAVHALFSTPILGKELFDMSYEAHAVVESGTLIDLTGLYMNMYCRGTEETRLETKKPANGVWIGETTDGQADVYAVGNPPTYKQVAKPK